MGSNSNPKKFAVILGARPNFVKAAPFFKEAKKHPGFKFTLIHTGQHFDKLLSEIFFKEMEIPQPDVMFEDQTGSHTEKIGRMFQNLTDYFQRQRFDGVIVFGDVNSTLAGAIAAAKNGLPIIHIESGLRSNDRRMPEEINRTIVDHLSDLLFTTEPSANDNLIKEGVDSGKIRLVGNIMIESLEIFWDKISQSQILDSLKLKPKTYFVATIHRQENTDDANILGRILSVLNEASKTLPVIFPVHPGTRKRIAEFQLDHLLKNLCCIEPLGYFEFMKLAAESRGIITDSGGIQEEASYLGIPCCTLRDNTERPITVELGSNKIFPIHSANSAAILEHLSRKDFKKKAMPLWDGKVSERIFKELALFTGRG